MVNKLRNQKKNTNFKNIELEFSLLLTRIIKELNKTVSLLIIGKPNSFDKFQISLIYSRRLILSVIYIHDGRKYYNGQDMYIIIHVPLKVHHYQGTPRDDHQFSLWGIKSGR